MYTESCPHCGNTVAGQFNPSSTRKYLTGLAKTGGMKAVLAAVGSVVPVFGNIGGFLAGGAIDLIYGDDIKKFIDKVADEFDDNKVYVFECPNCGHTWSRKEDDIQKPSCDFTSCHSIYDLDEDDEDEEDEEEEEDSVKDTFDKEFSAFVDEIDTATRDARSTQKLSERMIAFGDSLEDVDEVYSSQYYFLAGLSYLLYAKECQGEESVQTELERAFKYLEKANKLYPDREYRLMLEAVRNLQCPVPERCIDLGTLNTYKFDHPTLFKEDWLISIYESCRFLSILTSYHLVLDEFEKYDDELMFELWKSGLELQDKDYHMVCCINSYLLCEEPETSTGNLTIQRTRFLNDAFETEGYDIAKCNVDNFYDKYWLQAYVEYARSIFEGINPYRSQDAVKGLEMLMKATNLNDCAAKWDACHALGKYYEDGLNVNQNLDMALNFFSLPKVPKPDEEAILRVKSKIKLGQTPSHTPTNTEPALSSEGEQEYIEELKACFEDGEISKGERRLLEKLRIKLGISVERAAELEASLSNPTLADAEQEYLDEYRECLADGGEISAGERRLLNRLRVKLGISEARASELEQIG